MAARSASPAALQILQEVGVTDLPTGWGIVRIEDLLSDDRGISVGVMYPGKHDPSGIPLIKAADLNGSRINPAPEFRITREKHREYRRTELAGGELLISLVGNVGRCALVPRQMAGWNAARAIAVLRFERPADAAFVRACLMSLPLQHLMQAWSTTTVQATLNLKEIRQIPLPWPPTKERDAIAYILGTLDHKIELNRRISETLETMARALFKSWFVDFDPVRAKMEGRCPGLPKQIADLFPGRLVDSELGKIPQGWDVEDGYWCADVIYGAPFKSALFNEEGIGLPLVRIRDLRTHDPGLWTPEEHARGYLVQPGDLVVGMDGEFRAHLWRGPVGWLNQRVCCFKPQPGVPRAYVHYSIERLLDFFERSKTGTTVIHLGKGDIDTFRVLKPPPLLLRSFGALMDPVDSRIVIAAGESRTLSALREALLPRLISGELRPESPERFTARVGT